ncbi:type II toxin-antitoxin system Phd/YefM family antitoxin [Microbacterium sp.]|uniref:type II toxin-antitoxin system Phd/YefM family antitoxin n=1 Tax=Microbacterium sp. TaxID=51671 RepID=UPI0039E56223
MDSVGIRALKQNASEVVARAAAGESITVTDRGRPVARLTPLEQTTVARLTAAGLARPVLRPLAGLTGPTVGADASAVLRQMRDEERY